MRQENYLIALFNKELLDLRVPLPQSLKRFVTEEAGKGKVLTQALEWNLRFCLMEYLFDEHGRVRKVFLKSKNRAALIEGYGSFFISTTLLIIPSPFIFHRLRRRFIFMGILNAIFAPFIVLYLLMYSFFRYFEVRTDIPLPSLLMLFVEAGVSQGPVLNWRPQIYVICPLEV